MIRSFKIDGEYYVPKYSYATAHEMLARANLKVAYSLVRVWAMYDLHLIDEYVRDVLLDVLEYNYKSSEDFNEALPLDNPAIYFTSQNLKDFDRVVIEGKQKANREACGQFSEYLDTHSSGVMED